MSSRFVRQMFAARDGRNPYGSRGGYVTQSRPRDRAMGDRGYDQNRGDYRSDYARYGGRNDYMPYGGTHGDMRGRDYYDGRDYGDYGGYDMRGNDYGYNDYGDYNRGNDYNRGYDRGDYGNDYGSTEYGKLTQNDMLDWEHHMENQDGTKGFHFQKDQIEQMAKQFGIDAHKHGIEVVTLATNMMYSDYCHTAKKFGVDRPEFYLCLANDFLEDKDFHGKGEEKLWLYYKCIAEKDD